MLTSKPTSAFGSMATNWIATKRKKSGQHRNLNEGNELAGDVGKLRLAVNPQLIDIHI